MIRTLLCGLLVVALVLITPKLLAEPTVWEIPASEGSPAITLETFSDVSGATPPIIVLFHQARSSRGEYRQIAPRLVEAGYHCIAADLQGGFRSQGTWNETARRARQSGSVASVSAMESDMLRVLASVRKRYVGAKVIAMGSAETASLALQIAAEKPELLDGVMAFSPRSDLGEITQNRHLQKALRNLHQPAFLASPAAEYPRWKKLLGAIPAGQKQAFIPMAENASQGSRLLWPAEGQEQGYWAAMEHFLTQYFPAETYDNS